MRIWILGQSLITDNNYSV